MSGDLFQELKQAMLEEDKRALLDFFKESKKKKGKREYDGEEEEEKQFRREIDPNEHELKVEEAEKALQEFLDKFNSNVPDPVVMKCSIISALVMQ